MRLTAAAAVNVRPEASAAFSAGASSSPTRRIRPSRSWRWTQRAQAIQNPQFES